MEKTEQERLERHEKVKEYERRNVKIYGGILAVIVLVVVVWAIVSHLG